MAVPTRSCSPPAPATSRTSRRSPTACPPSDRRSSRRSTTATPTSSSDGGVLVVGASATRRADRRRDPARRGAPVTLAVGEHVRVPRTYRGRDIHWWMDAVGRARRALRRGRRHRAGPHVCRRCSWSASPERRDARPQRARRDRGRSSSAASPASATAAAQFSGSLANMCAARRPQARPPARHDRRVGHRSTASTTTSIAAAPLRAHRGAAPPPLDLDLAAARSSTIVWATGFRPDYSVARRPRPRPQGHGPPRRRRRGDAPGMYVLGLPFLRRRKSSFLDGVGPDALELSKHLASHLDRTASRV